MNGKLIIVSAPSGSGKSTLVNHLMKNIEHLAFSISATSRQPRGKEQDGKEYYFLTKEAFEDKINNNEFVEWEEVYAGRYYGTLKSEVNRIRESGNSVIFDVDVVGGVNIKKLYGKEALSIFIKPPSIEELEKRLKKRGTDNQDEINKRIEKAAYELEFENKFDQTIINDDLTKAKNELVNLVDKFLKQ
jgi:guanylate kinase